MKPNKKATQKTAVARLHSLKRKMAADFSEINLEEAVRHHLKCGYGIPERLLRNCALTSWVTVNDTGLCVCVNVRSETEA